MTLAEIYGRISLERDRAYHDRMNHRPSIDRDDEARLQLLSERLAALVIDLEEAWPILTKRGGD